MTATEDALRAVDNSPWDGNAAMSACDDAACYRSICAGRRSGDPSLRSSWALPHHKSPSSPPNAAGVRNALARLPQTQGLTNRAEAQAHLERHLSAIQNQSASAMPRDGLVRALGDGFELRESPVDDDGSMPEIVGHFARFGEWTEIDSFFEGHFMEQIDRHAFDRTFAEDRDRMRMLFQHGRDPVIGDKPLAPIEELRATDAGAFYSGRLLDTSYVQDLIPGLREGLYGASFRFRVEAEEIREDPGASEHNPKGLPERTITDATVMEFGPVTFPAYANATAGVRSLTDEFVFAELSRGEGLQRFSKWVKAEDRSPLTLKDIPTADKQNADKNQGTEEQPPEEQPPPTDKKTDKKEDKMAVDIDRFTSVELLATRRDEIEARLQYLHTEAGAGAFSPEVQAEWDELNEERDAIKARLKHIADRERAIDKIKVDPPDTGGHVESGDDRSHRPPDTTRVRKGPDNIYDLAAYRRAASHPGQEARMLFDGARRAIETSPMAMAGLDPDEARKRAEKTLLKLEKGDDDNDGAEGRLAAYLLAVGSPTYRRAFRKFAMSAPAAAIFASDEAASIQQAQVFAERAFTLGTTGLPVPFQLDPTVIPVSNGSVNPFRQVSRIVPTTVNEWRGATSAGITAAYAAEGTEASDNTPTLTQPVIPAVRAQAFVPFSIEVGQDWGAIEEEMTREVGDAKDDLEATKFTLGTGTNEPTGIITGATVVVTTTTAAFVIADLYKLEEAVPARFRPRSSVLGNRAILNKVRQFDTSGGSGVWLDVPGLAQLLPSGNGVQMPRGVLGYPTFEDTAMDAVLTTGSEILVMGDFRYYVIVDRVGMSADLIPHLVGTNHRPTGQRGLYFFWRNGAERVHDAAFRVLQT